MKILNLTLVGFKRLGFGQVESFDLPIEQFGNIVIGINGIGKSSLLRECSPISTDKNHFKEGGKKILKFEYNHAEYTVEIDYGKTVKCSLKKGEEIIHYQATQEQHNKTCELLFQYTKDIHDFIHSKTSFTNMSPKERKDWLFKLDKCDYTLGLELFKAFKDKYSATQTTLKVFKDNLIQHNEKIRQYSPEFIKDKIKTLESSMEAYQSFIVNDIQPTRTQINLEQEGLHFLKTIKKVLIEDTRFNNTLGELSRTCYQFIEDGEYKVTEAILKDNQEKLLRYHQSCLDNVDLNLSQVKQKEELSLLKEERDTLSTNILNQIEILKTTYRLNKIYGKENTELDLLNLEGSLGLKDLKLYKREDFEKYYRYMDNLMEQIADGWVNYRTKEGLEPNLENTDLTKISLELNTKLDQLKQEIHHLEHSLSNSEQSGIKGLLNCPECGYEIGKKIIEERSNLESRLEGLTNKLNIVNPLFNLVKNTLEHFTTLEARLENVFIDSNTINYLIKLLRSLSSDNRRQFYTYTDVNLSSMIKETLFYQDLLLKKEKLEKDIQSLETLLNSRVNSTSTPPEIIWSSKDIEKKIHSNLALEDKIGILELEINRNKDLLTLMSQEQSLKRTKEQTKLNIANRLTEIRTQQEKQFLFDLSQLSKQELDKIKIEIGNLLNEKYTIENAQRSINELTKNIEDLENELTVLKLLGENISPNKGLLSDSIKIFTKTFIERMNQIIASIWTYPLAILIPEEDADMSYKFPIQVGPYQEIIPDIALGSSGIKEVINLAFKLVSLELMGLTHYPLFLDEFGATFDSQHRSSAVNIIKQLIEEQRSSQLFLISHYETFHGGLPYSELIDLNLYLQN